MDLRYFKVIDQWFQLNYVDGDTYTRIIPLISVNTRINVWLTSGSSQPDGNPSGSRFQLPVYLYDHDAAAIIIFVVDKYSTGSWQYSTNPRIGHGPQFWGHVLMLGY